MRKRSLLLVAGTCLATLTLTVGTALADPPTPAPQFGHPPCTATSSPSSGPVRSVATQQPLQPVASSAPTTPVVSTPTPTSTTPTSTTTAKCATLFTTPQGNSATFLHLGADGNFWTDDGSNIMRMLSHAPYTQTTFPIPGAVHGGLFDITTGPDGNIWFTERGEQFCDPNGAPGRVGRILTHAPYTVTEFPVPGPVAKVYNIRTGGDGNLWFTRVGTGGCGPVGTPEIDRILPHAPYTITQYPLPAATPPLPAKAGPALMTADPQGNLWFSFLAIYMLGEISPFTHEIKLFNVGAGQLTAGPRQDPNSIWFIGNDNPPPTSPTFYIGRIDTITHAVIKHPVTFTGNPSNIGAGPDGNMWVTEARTGYVIGRFQTHAPFTFSEIPLPDDTYAIDAACGPDGNEWFSTNRFPSPPDNPQGNPAVIGRVNLTRDDDLTSLTGLIGSGLTGDLQSLLGGFGHNSCPAPTPGTFDGGQ